MKRVAREDFLDKVPGFRSRSPWKMVLASFGYVLIAVLAIYTISCLLVNVDVSLTVNSAYAPPAVSLITHHTIISSLS